MGCNTLFSVFLSVMIGILGSGKSGLVACGLPIQINDLTNDNEREPRPKLKAIYKYKPFIYACENYTDVKSLVSIVSDDSSRSTHKCHCKVKFPSGVDNATVTYITENNHHGCGIELFLDNGDKFSCQSKSVEAKRFNWIGFVRDRHASAAASLNINFGTGKIAYVTCGLALPLNETLYNNPKNKKDKSDSGLEDDGKGKIGNVTCGVALPPNVTIFNNPKNEKDKSDSDLEDDGATQPKNPVKNIQVCENSTVQNAQVQIHSFKVLPSNISCKCAVKFPSEVDTAVVLYNAGTVVDRKNCGFNFLLDNQAEFSCKNKNSNVTKFGFVNFLKNANTSANASLLIKFGAGEAGTVRCGIPPDTFDSNTEEATLSDDKADDAVIVGGVTSTFVAVILLIVCFLYIRNKRMKKHRARTGATERSHEPSSLNHNNLTGAEATIQANGNDEVIVTDNVMYNIDLPPPANTFNATNGNHDNPSDEIVTYNAMYNVDPPMTVNVQEDIERKPQKMESKCTDKAKQLQMYEEINDDKTLATSTAKLNGEADISQTTDKRRPSQIYHEINVGELDSFKTKVSNQNGTLNALPIIPQSEENERLSQIYHVIRDSEVTSL